jgi:hypothetical protein
MTLNRGLVWAVAAALTLGTLPLGASAMAVGEDFETIKVEGEHVRWNSCQTKITYQVNSRKAGKQKAQKKARKEVKRAMKKVKKATGLPLHYAGETQLVPTGSNWAAAQDADAEIVVAYAKRSGKFGSDLFNDEFSAGYGGVSYSIWGSPRNAVIDRGFVILDAKKTRNMAPGFKKGASRGHLLLHEIGHAVGLLHAARPAQLMFPQLSSATSGFTYDDQVGLDVLGAKSGCIDIPTYATR